MLVIAATSLAHGDPMESAETGVTETRSVPRPMAETTKLPPTAEIASGAHGRMASAAPVIADVSDAADELIRRPSRSKPVSTARQADSLFSSLGGSVILPMLIVVGTICGSAYFFRRLVNPGHKPGADGAIKVLSRQYLSSKQCLCLVRLGGRLVLLGVTPDRISAVAHIDDPEEVAGIMGDVNRAGGNTFSAALAAFAGRRTGVDADGGGTAAESADLVLPGKLFETRSNVREVLGRVRALSKRGIPAEPV
jgi:flagellar biogenesis protein FliO